LQISEQTKVEIGQLKYLITFLFLIIFPVVFSISCNGNPDKIASGGKKHRKIPKKKKKKKIEKKKIHIFGDLDINSRTLILPKDLERASSISQKIGVYYIKGEKALRSLKLIEYTTIFKGKGCNIDWVLHVWSGKRHVLGEIMWGCKILKIGKTLYKLEGTPRKVISTLIVKSRLHPNHWLSILSIPVVHTPKMVSAAIKGFVKEIIPGDYYTTRYPSFTVSTEHTVSLPGNFSLIDAKVKTLRKKLISRLETFSLNLKRRSKGSVFKILPPFAIKEKFTNELYAQWGETVLCTLGTNADKMFWLSNWPKIGILKIKIPTHYNMVVVKKNVRNGPSLFASISGLDLDPPIEFSTY